MVKTLMAQAPVTDDMTRHGGLTAACAWHASPFEMTNCGCQPFEVVRHFAAALEAVTFNLFS
jgi:hypothetical protein